MSYIPPSFEDTREFGSTIDAGWQDFSLVRMWDTVSKSDNPMLVGIFVADNGEHAGQELRDYYPLGTPKQFGESKLKTLGVKSGFKWQGGGSLEEFARQFVEFETPLRISIKVEHELAIKSSSGTWKNNVKQEEFDAWEGEKSIRPKVGRYGVAKSDPDLTLEPQYGDPSEETFVDEDEDFQSAAPDAGDSFDEDDDMPF